MSTIESKCIKCGHPFLVNFPERSGAAGTLDVVTRAFDEYLWGLSISPQPASGPCEKSVRYFRDSLLVALAAPSEPESDGGEAS